MKKEIAAAPRRVRVLVDAIFASEWNSFCALFPAAVESIFFEGSPPPAALKTAAALIIRSSTKIDATLLRRAPQLSFVGSATAGVDHVHQALLKQKGITFCHAPGHNREPVAEYVLAALSKISLQAGRPLSALKIGIVGVGQIGSRVAELLCLLGSTFLAFDPLLSRAEKTRLTQKWHTLSRRASIQKMRAAEFWVASLVALAECEVITLHVPLTKTGPYPTWQLLDAAFLKPFSVAAPAAYLINTSRGEVVDEAALLEAHRQGRVSGFILDVFCDEPTPALSLVERALFATPHVAGHSSETKRKGLLALRPDFMRCFQIATAASRSSVAVLPEGTHSKPPIETVLRELKQQSMRSSLSFEALLWRTLSARLALEKKKLTRETFSVARWHAIRKLAATL